MSEEVKLATIGGELVKATVCPHTPGDVLWPPGFGTDLRCQPCQAADSRPQPMLPPESLSPKEWLAETCQRCNGSGVGVVKDCRNCGGTGRAVRHQHDDASSLTAPSDEETRIAQLEEQLATARERARAAERQRDDAIAKQPKLWDCPACAFTFDAKHVTLPAGNHTCPNCAEERLEARVEVLEATLNSRHLLEVRSDLREKLASLAHEQWSGWIRYMLGKCEEMEHRGPDGSQRVLVIPAWAVERWTRQLATPYEVLSEEEKESDRKEADKVLAVLRGPEPRSTASLVLRCRECGTELNPDTAKGFLCPACRAPDGPRAVAGCTCPYVLQDGQHYAECALQRGSP